MVELLAWNFNKMPAKELELELNFYRHLSNSLCSSYYVDDHQNDLTECSNLNHPRWPIENFFNKKHTLYVSHTHQIEQVTML